MTLAIGDGANDVSMIQMADGGVGICGREGRQAVMASDFAMGQFRFLKRSLLAHGHWNYQQVAYLVLYNFYRNAVFALMLFWTIYHVVGSPKYWITILLIIVLALLPRFLFKIIVQQLFWPSVIQIAREVEVLTRPITSNQKRSKLPLDIWTQTLFSDTFSSGLLVLQMVVGTVTAI